MGIKSSLRNAPEYIGGKEPDPASSKLEEEQQAQAFIGAIYRAKPRLCQPTSQHEVFPGTLNPIRLSREEGLLMVKMRWQCRHRLGPRCPMPRQV